MAAPIHTLPCLDLTKDPKALEQGSPEWKKMCTTLREVLEKHGGVLVNYDTISSEQKVEKMFSVLPDLFSLPVETKRKNVGTIPYLTYYEPGPSYQAHGVEAAELVEKTRAFTQLMWPDGNDDFWQTMNSLISILQELLELITKMIFDSYSLGRQYEPLAENMEYNFRMTGYSPPPKEEPPILLPAHTDNSLLTVLCQNGVDGLEFQSKEGDWFNVNLSKGSFVILAAQGLRAWSNERIFAVNHRVTLSGDKKRASCALFCVPKGDYIVKAPDELADNEHGTFSEPYNYAKYRENSLSESYNKILGDEMKRYA